MQYKVLAAFLLIGSLTLAAPRTLSGACPAVSELTVEDFDFRGSYGMFYPHKFWTKQRISFGLKNPALDYKPACLVQSLFAADVVHRCNNLPPGHDTTFRFNWLSSELHINHTWICPRNARPVKAMTSITVPLSCVDAVLKPIFPETTDHQVFQPGKVECERITFQIPVA